MKAILIALLILCPAWAAADHHQHGHDHGHKHDHGEAGEAGEHQHHHDPQEIAERDNRDRYQWQLPERLLDTLDLEPGMAVADIGAGRHPRRRGLCLIEYVKLDVRRIDAQLGQLGRGERHADRGGERARSSSRAASSAAADSSPRS